MRPIFRTLYVLVILQMFICSVYADESWELVFTARDTVSYYSAAYCGKNLLYIYLDTGTSNISLGGTPWDASCDYQYGIKTIDFTNEYVQGSRIIFKLTRESSSKDIFLLYDVDVLHNGKPVRFSPWISGGKGNFENGGILAKELEDGWLNLGVRYPSSTGDYATLTSQPMIDAPELVINQSDLTFSKEIYKIEEGDNIQVSVTVHNIGGAGENNAQVSLYLNDILDQTKDAGSIGSGESKTINFDKIINFGSSNLLKVKAVVTPSDSDLEGKEDNNLAVKYILKERPYLFFSDVTSTYGYNHQSDEPYASWISSLGSYAASCLSKDYSSSSLAESTKADCALKMAAYYMLDSSRTEYADKAREALLHIGDSSSFTWVDRSMAGNAPPNTGNSVVSSDQNYGLSGCNGNAYRSMLYYGIAYNWVHNWIRDNKAEDLAGIRDNLAKLGAHLYLMNREIYSYGDELSYGRGTSLFECGDYGEGKIEILSALGVIALSILDYDGNYDDLDGNPHEWVRFTEQDFLNESQSGAYLSILRQMQSEDGMYQEGGGYRTYYSDAEFYFYSAYKDTFTPEPSLSDKYNLARTAMVYLPYTVQPNGAYPNYCVSYTKKWNSEYIALNAFEPDTTERKIIDRYINETIIPSQGLSTSGMASYEKIFTYNKTEPYADLNITWTSPKKLMHVFRSGWDRDALYSFLISHNEPAMSGHQPYQNDQLTFDIFAKGAYLVVDAGNERFLDQIGGSDSGHTAFLIYADGEYRPAPKLTKGQYGSTCQNPSYIRETLNTNHLDFVQGDMYVTQSYSWPSWYAVDNPFTFTRAMIMVDDDYIISFDKLNSSSSNDYKLTIPFGSADGHIGGSSDYDNWALGNLTIDEIDYSWYNYNNPDASNWKIEHDLTNVNEIIWKSKSDTDNLNPVAYDVNMTVLLNPSADVELRHFGMHYGTYGVNHEWVAPVIRVKRSGSNVKQLNVYYPTTEGDDHPTISQITVTGGTGDDYATKLIKGSIVDLMSISDGELITADKMKTNGRIAFCRSNNSRLDYFFINGGQEFSYDDALVFNSSEELMANLRFRSDRVYGHLSGDGYYTVAIKTGFNSTNISSVKFNGEEVEYTYLMGSMFLTLNGEGDLEIRSEGTDLMVSSEHIFFPPEVWEDSYVNISARVWNTGGLDAGSFVVQFLDGIQEIDTREISSLAAGDSVVESVLWYASPGGEHEIRVIVDLNDDVTNELNEDNNEGNRSLYVSYQADLGLNMTDISFSKNLPVEGEEILVYADINNDGGVNVTGVIVQCFDGVPSADNQIGNKTVDIERTSEVRVNFTWTAEPAWTHGIYILLDPLNTVNESNEGNNLAYRLIYVQTKADLVLDPEDILFTPEEPMNGDSVLITAKVRNTGEANASSFTVQFLNGGYTIGEENAGVTGSNNISVNTTWVATPGGTHNIFIILDPENTVDESIEGNNDANTSVYVNPATGTTTTTSSTSTTTMAGNTSTTSTSSTTTTTIQGATTTTIGDTSTTSTSSTSTTTTTTTTTSTTLPPWEPVLIVGGGRGDENGELYDPVDVTVDINGSIYVLERYNERIQKFDEDGVFKEIYGESGSSGLGEFDGPGGITIREVNATTTQLFIADTDNHRIQIMTNELRTTEDNDTILNTSWQAFGERCYENCVPWVYIYFEDPWGVDVDDSGRIYVADTGNNRISIIYDLPANLNKYPTPHNRTDLNGFNEPKAVSVKNDRIYVADTGNNQVKILNLTGSEINSISGLNEPSSIALDSEDNIYVADTLNNRIMIFNPQGFYITEFGEENCSAHIYNDPEAAAGQFCMPEGIEIKGEKIYVADTGNHRIQVFETRELPPATCTLPGDYPPCGEVTLGEVIDYLNQWSQGQASLAEVIDLINAWASG